MFCSGCGVELPRESATGQEPADATGASSAHPSQAVAPVGLPASEGGLPGAVAPAQSPRPFVPPAYNPPPDVQYAGFWLRVVAYFVDTLVLAPVGLIGFAILGGTIVANLGKLQGDPDPAVIMSLFGAYALTIFVSVSAAWLYHAFMESSRHEGTLGKKAMGLRVTDMNGNRISFGRASGRFFGKMITGMTMGIGYAMAGFTERRQCLHDMLAGCLVVKK